MFEDMTFENILSQMLENVKGALRRGLPCGLAAGRC